MRHLLLVLLASAALAQTKPPADLQLTPADRARLIEDAASRIDRLYVDPLKAKEIAKALRDAATSGKFDAATSALLLVPAVNTVLRTSGDLHLRFGYSAEAESVEDDAPPTPEQRAIDEREAARDGYGIHGVTRLEGNVGLLTVTALYDPEDAGGAVMHAMQLLRSTDALIIDLRGCTGGSVQMVNLLLTYFLPEGDPVLISTVYHRPEDARRQYWTLPWVPGPRYTGKKVYLLTSKRTFSGGEGFTEHMRRMAHSNVVGETTRGGSHPTRWYHIDPHFAVSVPVARHVGPPAINDWEGVGITPDVVVPAAEALTTAHVLALRSLRDGAHDQEARTFYEDALAQVEKQPR
jgi:hypothetical protein